jgi:membrane fusion protein (multidrug efflux system)
LINSLNSVRSGRSGEVSPIDPAKAAAEDASPAEALGPQAAAQDPGSVGPSGSGDAEGEQATPRRSLSQHPILLVTGATLLALALLGGVVFWLHARHFESTDDAFIDAHIVRLAPQVSGRITQALVDDNQIVTPGQLLVVIDSADSETRVAQALAQRAQAQAQLDNATVQIGVNQANYQQAQADVAAASAQADNAARDLARYRALQSVNPAAVAQQQFDQALALARQTAAQREALAKAAGARADQVKASLTLVVSGEDQVRAAQAQVDEANLNLGYARIVAPVAGHVAQNSVAVGNYVQPGTQILAIVPLDVWVTANFKETQLALMRVGQKVSVHVDGCPQDQIEAHVDSIQRGAGQAFSILPAENATGNFVKVVQRVPVKIVLDHPPKDCLLGPGMSVEPTVTVR